MICRYCQTLLDHQDQSNQRKPSNHNRTHISDWQLLIKSNGVCHTHAGGYGVAFEARSKVGNKIFERCFSTKAETNLKARLYAFKTAELKDKELRHYKIKISILMDSKGIQFVEKTNVENQTKIKTFLTKINERKLERKIANYSTEPVSHKRCQFER